MKKFTLIFILIFYPIKSIAHMSHYADFNQIEMEIFRNGKLVGYNYYFFSKKGDETIVSNQIKFSIKILGSNIFEVEGYGEEKYIKDQLISFDSRTLQNKKEKFVNLVFNQKEKKYDIIGSSFKGQASIENIIGNWWNHKILQTQSQISPVSGSIKKQVVTFIGDKKITLYGKVYDVKLFSLKSEDMSIPKDKRLDFNIWYDNKNFRIVKVSYSNMGHWEYRLKNIK
tara:strand:+ start:400 stop:1080 length:681 start_codon:yes stop_codon:yes gene_type:complete